MARQLPRARTATIGECQHLWRGLPRCLARRQCTGERRLDGGQEPGPLSPRYRGRVPDLSTSYRGHDVQHEPGPHTQLSEQPGRRSGRRSPEQQKSRSSRTGSDLRIRWWRGRDLNPRPSGYEHRHTGLRPSDLVGPRSRWSRSAVSGELAGPSSSVPIRRSSFDNSFDRFSRPRDPMGGAADANPGSDPVERVLLLRLRATCGCRSLLIESAPQRVRAGSPRMVRPVRRLPQRQRWSATG